MSTNTLADQLAPPKGYGIIVNTRSKTVESEYVTYEEVVSLAFDPPPSGPYILITVKYRKGPRGSKGSLLPGKKTKVAEGMIFNVRVTDQS